MTHERVPIYKHSDLISGQYSQDVCRYQFANSLFDGKSVLDIGCGTGYGIGILTNVDLYAGIDISFEALNEARRVWWELSNSFVCANVMSLPFRDKMFDVVICFETIEHVGEPIKLLHEIYRILKDDGIAVISTPVNELPSRFAPNNPYHLREYSRHEFRSMILERFDYVRFYLQVSRFENDPRLDVFNKLGLMTSVKNRLKQFMPHSWRKRLRKALKVKSLELKETEIVRENTVSVEGAHVQLAVARKSQSISDFEIQDR